MKLTRHWWFVSAGAILVTSLALSLALPKGYLLAAFGDVTALLLFLIGTGLLLRNAIRSKGQTRAFWALLSLGSLMWTINQVWWTWYEIIWRRPLPDPCAADIVLFLHLVPFIAAIALRPQVQEEEKLHLSTLNFLMLLAWWIFLYAFIVFPDEYVVLNVRGYSRNYDVLYLCENLMLLGGLGIAVIRTKGGWRWVYANLLGAGLIYSIASQVMNAAIAKGKYYTGSSYDVLFFAGLCWFIWVAIGGQKLALNPEPRRQAANRWLSVPPRLAMLAILSLPTLGFWVLLFDASAPRLRQFRLLTCLLAMLILGAFIFLKQYLLDRKLMRLLAATDRSYKNLHRLQDELIQKEKLASLGQLVAAAAREINLPVTAILKSSEVLCSDLSLPPTQVSMARKIGQQARRTRDLVGDLLSFAQQTPTEKTRLDISMLLQRTVQMQMQHMDGKNIRVELQISPALPPVLGNANQLLGAFLQIARNGVEALQEVGGGTITISASAPQDEVIISFADTGPGIREPHRVFDPFYTTKPVGKGTGLGLSATYGVVQQHGGLITCCNRPEGGALFVLRLPAAPYPAAVASEVAHV